MHRQTTIGATLLLTLLASLGACASQPHPTASPTAPTTPSATLSVTATPSPTPTPTPIQESIGPDGTVIAKDGKLWFACKNGIYTIDIPEGFSPEERQEGGKKNTLAQSASDPETEIELIPRLDLLEVPSPEEMRGYLSTSLVLPWEIRDDLTDFAGHPATTVHFSRISTSPEPDPNFDGTILSMHTTIGDTYWILNFTGTTREEAEALLHQAAKTLKAVQEW
ncbi:hypothetical protein [Buchananella hordeovulneris]|uniref:hypothetical protein n=1 Tax=Buchananella hordeovulneris TaxID=52770 RepID=UPI001161519B|nr:hypothetical protein [Buchananella hordeovulneris]